MLIFGVHMVGFWGSPVHFWGSHADFGVPCGILGRRAGRALLAVPAADGSSSGSSRSCSCTWSSCGQRWQQPRPPRIWGDPRGTPRLRSGSCGSRSAAGGSSCSSCGRGWRSCWPSWGEEQGDPREPPGSGDPRGPPPGAPRVWGPPGPPPGAPRGWGPPVGAAAAPGNWGDPRLLRGGAPREPGGRGGGGGETPEPPRAAREGPERGADPRGTPPPAPAEPGGSLSPPSPTGRRCPPTPPRCHGNPANIWGGRGRVAPAAAKLPKTAQKRPKTSPGGRGKWGEGRGAALCAPCHPPRGWGRSWVPLPPLGDTPGTPQSPPPFVVMP
ncbi:proline-rich protein 2-like isoform X1 [Passer domesticus]|uniref:proline-rich protein 2-like isoform X1 n=1 Tax=Passer domesticus TaxID=48849 RepID=UPI0030FE4E25